MARDSCEVCVYNSLDVNTITHRKIWRQILYIYICTCICICICIYVYISMYKYRAIYYGCLNPYPSLPPCGTCDLTLHDPSAPHAPVQARTRARKYRIKTNPCKANLKTDFFAAVTRFGVQSHRSPCGEASLRLVLFQHPPPSLERRVRLLVR